MRKSHLSNLGNAATPLLILCALQAMAHVGSDLAAGSMVSLLALLGSVLLALFAVCHRPVRRGLAGRKRTRAGSGGSLPVG